jgi:hypothetical protein
MIIPSTETSAKRADGFSRCVIWDFRTAGADDCCSAVRTEIA